MKVRTVDLPANLFNQASPTFNLIFIRWFLQYFVDIPQADPVPALSTAQASPEAETDSARMNIFVPHFPIFHFSGREEVTKGHAQHILPVIMQQGLLQEYKPQVDWLKVAVVQDNGLNILGFNPDPFLLAVDNALMEHWMRLHKSDPPSC